MSLVLALLLTLPGIGLLVRARAFPWDGDLFYGLMHDSGELSTRLLLVALLATPLQRIWPRSSAVKWLRRNRRVFGVSAFGYAALHLAFYLVHRETDVVADLGQWTYRVGWGAFALMVPLAVTSRDAAVRRLGIRRWRALHRAAYGVALGIAAHWLLKPEGEVLQPVLLHFAPLALLELNRLRLYFRRRRASS